MERRKALLIGVISVILLGGGAVAGVVVSTLTGSGPVGSRAPGEVNPQAGCSPGRTPASCGTTAVLGETYQICAKPRYLTSPWKYHALASGSKSYTVAQYKSLSGYGTTLPPLPGYIAAEGAATEAAIIYAPGSSANVPAYARPETPVLQFFEGGAYGEISMQSVSGDEFIGGTAAATRSRPSTMAAMPAALAGRTIPTTTPAARRHWPALPSPGRQRSGPAPPYPAISAIFPSLTAPPIQSHRLLAPPLPCRAD